MWIFGGRGNGRLHIWLEKSYIEFHIWIPKVPQIHTNSIEKKWRYIIKKINLLGEDDEVKR